MDKNLKNYTAIACQGKRAFDSHGVASEVAREMNKRHTSSTINVYKCKHCHKFHVGNGSPRKPKALNVSRRDTPE